MAGPPCSDWLQYAAAPRSRAVAAGRQKQGQGEDKRKEEEEGKKQAEDTLQAGGRSLEGDMKRPEGGTSLEAGTLLEDMPDNCLEADRMGCILACFPLLGAFSLVPCLFLPALSDPGIPFLAIPLLASRLFATFLSPCSCAFHACACGILLTGDQP